MQLQFRRALYENYFSQFNILSNVKVNKLYLPKKSDKRLECDYCKLFRKPNQKHMSRIYFISMDVGKDYV